MTASTPMRCGRSASVGFCTVRDLATKRLPESIPSLLVSTVTAALVTVCGAFLVGPMGGWSPVSMRIARAAGDGGGAAARRLSVHHHGDAHRRDLLRRAVPLHRAAVGDPARLPGFRRRARWPDDRSAPSSSSAPASTRSTASAWSGAAGRRPPAPTPGHGARRALSHGCRRAAPAALPAARGAGRRTLDRAWAAATRACGCSAAGRCSRTCSTGWRRRPARSRSAPMAIPRASTSSACRCSPTRSQAISARWPACSPACSGQQGLGATHIVSMPTDTPFFPDDLGASLWRSRSSAERAGACRLGRPAPSGRRPVAGGARRPARSISCARARPTRSRPSPTPAMPSPSTSR